MELNFNKLFKYKAVYIIEYIIYFLELYEIRN